MRIRYIVGLACVAVLTMTGHGVVQFMLADQAGESVVVNLAGRQRMLSQKITKAALSSNDEELLAAVTDWRRTHHGLQAGDEELGLDGRNSERIDAMFLVLSPHYQAMSEAVDRILESTDETARAMAIAQIKAHEGLFLKQMNDIVYAYSEEQEASVGVFRALELGAAVLTLTVLLLEVFFIFEPAIRALGKSWERLQRSEKQYELAVDGSGDAIWDWDLVNNRIDLAGRFAEMVGISPNALGHDPSELLSRISSNFLTSFTQAISAVTDGETDEVNVEVRIRHRDATERWVLCRAAALRDDEGTAVQLAGSLADITELKEAQDQLRRVAELDQLTELVNRSRFTDQVEAAIARHHRGECDHFGVFFFDFDRFKTINDSLGHAVGDALLKSIARRLEKTLPTAVCARFGGDEFAVLYEGSSERDVHEAADKALEVMRDPHLLGSHSVVSTASIGVVLSNERYDSAAEMIRDADTAMYRAKSTGRGRVVLFDQEMHQEVVERQTIETLLITPGIETELRMVYQPIVSIADNTVVGFEALVRWDRPDAEPVATDTFIDIAEECGAIDHIGSWIFREAARQLAEWDDELKIPGLRLSINLSRKQLLSEEFVEELRTFAKSRPHLAERIVLEITETAMMDQRVNIVPVLESLRDAGFKLAMDDFGTGYSSLSCLHQFPLDMLKVDRSFVQNMEERREFTAVFCAIVTLAQNLGLGVISEGVDRHGQLAQLQAIDCEFGQGYLFAKPLSADDARQYLVDNRVASGGRKAA